MAEKKSLRRFLLVYIVSTMLIIGIGEWFYYKSQVHFIIDRQVSDLSNKLKLFLTQNRGMIRKVRFGGDYSINGNIKIAVYRDFSYMFGNFKPEKIDFKKEFWNDKDNVYYLLTMPKRWARIDILVSEKLDKKAIKRLQDELVVFNVFVIIFIFVIAVILGKIFLKPMKDIIFSLENFIRDATHEMNTPLSVILTNIEMLQMKNSSSKELERIEFSAKRLEKIFKDLTYIRLNHKQRKNIEKIDLKELICQRLNIFSTLIEQKRLTIDKKCKKCEIEMDMEDAVRLIDNIISNAVKYAPFDSVISVCLDENSFSVLNLGEIKNPNKITDKFYRENQNEGGFGIGLYIVKKICKEYGFEFKIFNKDKKVVMEVLFK